MYSYSTVVDSLVERLDGDSSPEHKCHPIALSTYQKQSETARAQIQMPCMYYSKLQCIRLLSSNIQHPQSKTKAPFGKQLHIDKVTFPLLWPESDLSPLSPLPSPCGLI